MSIPLRPVSLEGHEDLVHRMAFFPEGNRVITACFDNISRVFHADTGALIYAFDQHKAPITGLAVLGANIVATGDDEGVICVWDAKAKRSLYSAVHDPVASLATLSPSSFVSGHGDGGLLFFHHRGGEDVAVLHSIPEAHSEDVVSIAAHGRRMVTGSLDGMAKVWYVDSREALATLDGNHANDWVHDVSIGAKYIVTATGTDVLVWDAVTFALLRKIENKIRDKICSVLITGGSHVLTTSVDKTISVSDLATGATVDSVILDFHVFGVAATSDGRIAAFGNALGNADEIAGVGSNCAIIFPAPYKTARIMRAPAAAAAMHILGWQGSQSGRGFYANSAEVRSWRAVANLPLGR